MKCLKIVDGHKGVRTLGIKSFFSKLFTDGDATNKIIKMISSPNNYFSPWNGKIFEGDVIRSCIRPKANAIGKLSAKHMSGEGEKLKINQEAWLKEILKYPNKYMTMQEMLMKMVFQRELNHNAFAYVERDLVGYPMAIYPITPTSVELIEDSGQTFLKFWLLNGKNMIVSYDDIIHIRKDFNSEEFFGESGIKAISGLMEVLNATDQSIITAVKNSAVIKWILKFKSVLQPKDIEIQVNEFVKNYLSIEKGGAGAAASDPRYELEQVKNENFVPNAAQIKETIQRLYSYFGVNEKIVQNKYNEDEFNAFYESELEPMIINLSDVFTKVFFTRRERGFGNRIVFETSNLAYASMSTKLQLVQFVDRGMMTPNEVREIMNLGRIEGGDKPIRRLDTAVVENTKESKEPEDTTKEVKEIEEKVLAV